MKQLKAANVLDGSLNYQIEPGQWGLFAIRFEGVPATNQTVLLTDLGDVILRWNGNDVINVDFEFLNNWGELYGGEVAYAQPSGGVFWGTVFIKPNLFFDPINVFDISEADKVELVLRWNAAKMASGTVFVFGKPKRGVMSYIPGLRKRVFNFSGAGTYPEVYPVENITALYFKALDARVDSIQIARDGKVVADGDVDMLKNYTYWIHHYRPTINKTVNLIAVEFVEDQNLKSAVSTSVSVVFKAITAGVLETYYQQLIPMTHKMDQSLARALANVY